MFLRGGAASLPRFTGTRCSFSGATTDRWVGCSRVAFMSTGRSSPASMRVTPASLGRPPVFFCFYNKRAV